MARKRTYALATPSLHVRQIATVVYLLCGNAELAAIWASRSCRVRRATVESPEGRVSEETVLSWVESLQEDTAVKAALQALDHHMRELADDFLMETLVIEDLLTYWARGIQTTTEVAITSLIRKWRMRPRSERKDIWLRRLAGDIEYRKSWARYFRNRWNLRWAGDGSCRFMTSAVLQAKAAIFIRWIHWAMRPRDTNLPAICINMDETTISCLKRTKYGMVAPAAFNVSETSVESKRQGGFPRCALIASIVNDDALQPKLPQVFLPKTRATFFPPKKIRGVFIDAGPPIRAYHGGSGFQSPASMRQWLRDLRHVLLAHRPNHEWVLVMDCYSVHTSRDVLRYARSLKFVVVLVPSRMTWLLQPLDTHVFADFKRTLRRLIMTRRIDSNYGRITWSEGLKTATQAVLAKLVQGSWRLTMRGAGMGERSAALQPAIRDLLSGVDLTPRPPALEEMRTVLGTGGPHVKHVWELVVLCNNANGGPGTRASASVMPPTAAIPSAPTTGAGHHTSQPRVVTSATSASQATQGETTERRVPRGRRLWTPQPRNLMLMDVTERRRGPSAGTRSQPGACLPGVVQTDSQTRGHKRKPSLSSML